MPGTMLDATSRVRVRCVRVVEQMTKIAVTAPTVVPRARSRINPDEDCPATNSVINKATGVMNTSATL
ncbi:hypothetical protein [Arthrobacter sp. SDTb3-6]|uniref:hypothetical protein n=1 Tax=Arthrobacter sp. SDTb3-6 TaxID=2713571 RepID=UPI00210AAFA1|nr:hypothetical protein [Arthrobacter sp. SDTb3-6]